MKTYEMINLIEDSLDDIVRYNDLVKLGVFIDKQHFESIRRRDNNSIPYFKFKGSYRFLKNDIIDFIKKNKNIEEEYTGKFFIKKSFLEKNSNNFNDIITNKVNILFNEFKNFFLKNCDSKDITERKEWDIAILNFAISLVINSINIYPENKRDKTFDSVCSYMKNTLMNPV